jgi:hypothetical protein
MSTADSEGCLPAAQVDETRCLVSEWLYLGKSSKGRTVTFLPERPRIAVPSEPLCNHVIDKFSDVIACILGHVVRKPTDLLKDVIKSVLPVKELPYINAGRAQTKAIARTRVKQNCPVVKLISENYERVGYGFLILFQGSVFPTHRQLLPQKAITSYTGLKETVQTMCQEAPPGRLFAVP